jgi:hypothetical protein
VAKVVAPLVFAAGGTAAFVAARADSPSRGELRAWIDSPLDSSTLAAGPLDVIAHASGPGQLARFELVVDGVVVGEFGPLAHSDRLASGSNRWTATVGTHSLVARARIGSTIVDSSVVDVVVTDDETLRSKPPRGEKPIAPVATTTTAPTATTPTTEAPATTTATTTATTAPDPETSDPTVVRTAPTTSSTTLAPGEPPRIAGILLTPQAPTPLTPNTDVSVLVRADSPSGRPITISIWTKSPTGDYALAKTCTASPCVLTKKFGVGVWQYQAVVTDDLSRTVTSDLARFNVSGG